MIIAVVQAKRIPLASVYRSMLEKNLADLNMLNLSKPDIQMPTYGAVGGNFTTSTRTEDITGIKKGSALNAALWDIIKKIQSSAASNFALIRRRFLTSRCKAVTTNCPVVSPDSFSSSTAFAISCGTRAAIVCDFEFTDFVAITDSQHDRCSTVWQKKRGCKHLTCSTPVTNMVFNTLSTGVPQIAKPGSASTLTGPLTTNDRLSIEVAMSNSTTSGIGQFLIHSNNFQFRFLALSRFDITAKPCRISIEAATEQEARRKLTPLFILSLAARLPVQEVAHV